MPSVKNMFVVIVMVLLGLCVQNCYGGLLLDESVPGIGDAGSEIVNTVVPQHRRVGLQEFPIQSNLSVVLVSHRDQELICEWLYYEKMELLGEFFDGVDIMLYENELACRGDHSIGSWSDPRYFKKYCIHVPVLLASSGSWYPGIFLNSRTPFDMDLKKWVEIEGHPCFVLSGYVLDGLFSNLEESIRFRGTLEMDDKKAQQTFDSFMVALVFRGLIPILYLSAFVRSSFVFMQRWSLRKLSSSYLVILVLNSVQGFVFMVTSILGAQFLTTTLTVSLTLMLYTNGFGLSVSTDLVFGSILAKVRRETTVQKTNNSKGTNKIVIIAVLLTVIDVCMMLYLGLDTSYMSYDLVVSYYPIVVTVFSVCANLFVVNETRQLARLLLQTIPSQLGPSATIRAQRYLASIFYFWSKITICSFILNLIGIGLIGTGIYNGSPYVYLLTLLCLNTAKVLNLYSQSSCCVVPRASKDRMSSIILGLSHEGTPTREVRRRQLSTNASNHASTKLSSDPN